MAMDINVKERDNKKDDATIIGNLASDKVPMIQNVHSGNEKLCNLSEEIEKLAKQRAKCTPESTGGYAAELHHKYTFEADAIKKGNSNIEAQLGPRGGYGSKGSADIKVVDKGNVVSEAGLKYRGKATETTFDQSNIFDNGRQKICPSDQVDKVRELSNARAKTGTLKAPEYSDTATNASDRLKYKNIESQPMSKAESVEVLKDPSRYSKQAFKSDIKVSAKSGAIGGAAASGVISIVSNTVACAKGDKDITDAVVDVVTDTSTGATKGAIIGAGSEVIKRGLVNAGAKSIAKGSAPIAIASTALEAGLGVAKEAKKMIEGEQDLSEFAINSAGCTVEAAAKGGAAYAGAELGAIIGTFGGPVGTVVGGLLGGTVGFIAGESAVNGVKEFFGWR